MPIEPTQRIQPWWFGDKVQKTTCLWLKGLEPLKPYYTEKPQFEFKEWVDKNGKPKRENIFLYEITKKYNGKKRQIMRSKTFPSVAKAMAEQWTENLI